MRTNPAPRERASNSLYERVFVDGRIGQRWQDGFRGDRLTFRQLPPGYEALRAWASETNQLVARMSDGDIILIGVQHPAEQDNNKRGYYLTSIAINKAVPAPSGQYTVRELSYEAVRDLVVTPGQQIAIGITGGEQLLSSGIVTELVSFDSTQNPSDSQLGSTLQTTTIMDDFRSQIG